MHVTKPLLLATRGFPALFRKPLEILQLNLGYVCNRGIKVIDRCNLTILEASGYDDLAEFLAAQQVEITASLPCYLEQNVDKQRGKSPTC